MKSTARIISIFIPVLLAMQAAVAKPETITPSTEVVREVLTEALCGPDGEYAAHATYQSIMDKFGGKLPYANIIKAESRHIGALQRQFEKYGLAIPKDTRAGHVQAPASLAEAAQLGIEAEKANVAMYDRLLARVAGYPDLARVLGNLQRASRDHHLPAFQAAAAGDGQCPASGCRR